MAGGKIIKYPQDALILREGDLSTDMYKILKGHVEVYVGYQTPVESLLGILGEQACFGELGLLLNKPSIYTVVAYSDVLLMRIGEEDFADFVRDNHRNIIDIMRNMAGTMMTMRLQIDLLLKEIESGKQTKEIKAKIRDSKRIMRQYAIYQAASRKNPS